MTTMTAQSTKLAADLRAAGKRVTARAVELIDTATGIAIEPVAAASRKKKSARPARSKPKAKKPTAKPMTARQALEAAIRGTMRAKGCSRHEAAVHVGRGRVGESIRAMQIAECAAARSKYERKIQTRTKTNRSRPTR